MWLIISFEADDDAYLYDEPCRECNSWRRTRDWDCKYELFVTSSHQTWSLIVPMHEHMHAFDMYVGCRAYHYDTNVAVFGFGWRWWICLTITKSSSLGLVIRRSLSWKRDSLLSRSPTPATPTAALPKTTMIVPIRLSSWGEFCPNILLSHFLQVLYLHIWTCGYARAVAILSNINYTTIVEFAGCHTLADWEAWKCKRILKRKKRN